MKNKKVSDSPLQPAIYREVIVLHNCEVTSLKVAYFIDFIPTVSF